MHELIQDGRGAVRSWASVLDERTRAQAQDLASLPIVAGHVALMADAHLGKGATIGSVLPTRGAIVPAAVGVDIGCGMVAARTPLTAADLPDDLTPLLRAIERGVPAGVGRGHDQQVAGDAWLAAHAGEAPPLEARLARKAADQFGTLGSGNHFCEVSLDEDDRVWVVLHSGSRGVGNMLAQQHIAVAREVTPATDLPDRDLAWLVEGTDAFAAYWRALHWSQAYAYGNRERMVDVVLAEVWKAVKRPEAGGDETVTPARARRELAQEVVNCHHNYTARERHGDEELLVTRKGAIRARSGDLGIIPGSMGTGTYLVRGRGSAEAFDSAPHGAGRAMSRTQARKRFTGADLTARMGTRTWLSDRAAKLVDEIPDAYKDVDRVLADSADLVEVVHRLRAVLNYKGT